MEKIVCANPQDLIARAVSNFEELVAQLRQQKSELTILLTGGTLGIEFVSALAKSSVQLSGINFMFGDERFVAVNHADRNEQQALDAFPGLSGSLVRFPNDAVSLDVARQDFAVEVAQLLGPIESPTRDIDLTILGMGPDGHVASLFPNREHERAWIVSESNSPKPPSERLSFSYEALNLSERVWFLAAGNSKADALREALEGRLPAGNVRGQKETRWYLDQEISDAL